MQTVQKTTEQKNVRERSLNFERCKKRVFIFELKFEMCKKSNLHPSTHTLFSLCSVFFFIQILQWGRYWTVLSWDCKVVVSWVFSGFLFVFWDSWVYRVVILKASNVTRFCRRASSVLMSPAPNATFYKDMDTGRLIIVLDNS